MTPQRKKHLWLALKILGTVAGLGYVLSIIDLDDIATAAGQVTIGSVVASVTAVLVAVLIGSIRWQVVLRAYGAERPPSILRLCHLTVVSAFYSYYLPGGVGGEAVRGFVTRESFPTRGATGSFTVVLIDRVVGLAALLSLVAFTLWMRPIDEVVLPWPVLAAGLAAAGATILGVAGARRLVPYLPGFLGRLAGSVPPLRRPVLLVMALILAWIGHGVLSLAGHAYLVAVHPPTTVVDSLTIVPVAAAAAFFPLSVGGAGVREGIFIVLCGALLGLDAGPAAAVSLMFWATMLALAGAGGILQLVRPLSEAPASEAGSESTAGADDHSGGSERGRRGA